MQKILLLLISLFILVPTSMAQESKVPGSHLESINPDQVDWSSKDDSYWKENLTPEQYKIRQGGTERPFTGELLNSKAKGNYMCSNCGQVLFSSDTKFDSGSGWPSFSDVVNSSAVTLIEDSSHGMRRTEVRCSRCGAHLGHVFPDGPTPTNQRYCINSASLLPEEEMKK